jgi:two-component system OmpR family sensor kinase
MALERFAAGDLSPRPIEANMRHELGVLAEAYNGAIAQVEHAFGERDKANASIRQFIADAGHELRTPLTVIRGFIAILRKGELRDPADYARILNQMNRQSLVMGSLIDKLMLLDRWERDAFALAEPIDVAQLVDDVVTPIAEARPAREVQLELEHGPLVAIDPGDFTHAITNLVDNALKYTSGTVEVRVRSEGGQVAIEVADQGPGMTADEARHAFDRFFRGGRRDVEGSGLGLAIARRAVERADGTIELDSGPERGSTFTIRLPRRAADVRLERYATL